MAKTGQKAQICDNSQNPAMNDAHRTLDDTLSIAIRAILAMMSIMRWSRSGLARDIAERGNCDAIHDGYGYAGGLRYRRPAD